MRRSKVRVYLHFVWATAGRLDLLKGPLERMVYRCIQSEVKAKGCTLLAIGGMPDHVHLAVSVPAALAPADLAGHVKGV